MYSSKNAREVNVLVNLVAKANLRIHYSPWDLPLEERIAVQEHKQRAQQHVLKSYRQQQMKKISVHENQIRELRKQNRRKRKQLAKIDMNNKKLPNIIFNTHAQQMLKNKLSDAMTYEHIKLGEKLKEKGTYYTFLKRQVRPTNDMEIRDRATDVQCRLLESRLSNEAMRSNMAHTILLYYREIRAKFDQDHPCWPPRIRELKYQLHAQTTDLMFLKRAARLAIGEKCRAVRKYQKMYYNHVKDREERRREQQSMIERIRNLKEDFVPFPEIKTPDEPCKVRSPRTTFEKCLRALSLQEAFDTMKQNIPGGGNTDTVIERLTTQVAQRKKLHQHVDELNAQQARLQDEVEKMKHNRSLVQYGGNGLVSRHAEYARQLEEATSLDSASLEKNGKELKEHSVIVEDIRSGLCSILDTLRGAHRKTGSAHPTDVMKLFSSASEKLDVLCVDTQGVRQEDLLEVRRPGFRHFMENVLDRLIGDDPVCRILGKNQSVIGQRDEDLDADMDSRIDMDEFRNALKNKSVKLYLSRCGRMKAVLGVPAEMKPQWCPDKHSNHPY